MKESVLGGLHLEQINKEGLLPSQPVYNHRKLPVSYPGGGGAGGSLAIYTLGKQVTMLLEVTVM